MAGTRTDIFWCKVFFKAFIKHFRKMTDEEIVRDIRQSMDDLEDLVEDTDTFGSQMVRWANERADEPFATAARENGKKGGRPRKNKTIPQDADTREGKEGNAPPSADHIEARESQRTEGLSMSKGNSSSSPSVLPSLAYAGRGGNVHLTDDEYVMLLQELGNKRKADKLIDSLDYAISEGKTFNAPHFHVLMHWNDYREEKAEERAKDMKVKAEAFAEASKKQGLKSNADKMDEMMAGAKHLIDMYRLPEVKNG